MLDTLPMLPDAELRTLLPASTAGSGDEAGFGALNTERGCLPLVSLEIRARLDGLFASMELQQTFFNPHDQPLEATYIFPLPDRAAVTRFRLEVAGRTVEGQLQERGQARQTYDAALQAGHRAAIAEEERPGVFTIRVGNLPPGQRAVVHLALVGPLPYSQGEVTFRFPLVVAPRYVPGTPLPGPATGSGTASDTVLAPDASRISPPVLLPGFPNPVHLGLSVEVLETSLSPCNFRSSLHTVIEQDSVEGKQFRLHPGERLDRDFVLRYRVGSTQIVSALLCQPDEGGVAGTFQLTLLPPVELLGTLIRPRNIIFVLDRSGSMSGWKMVAARRAVARMIETLTEVDRFTIYAFDDRIETPEGFDGVSLVPGSDRQRYRATEFLAQMDARGGTEMARPLQQAAEQLIRGAPDSERLMVLITDCQVSNEDHILRELGPLAGKIRIFTLGIDRAVNAAFLRRLADVGGGTSEVVESESRLDEVMDQVHRLIGTPVLQKLRLSGAGLEMLTDSLVPERLPDLFAGTPVVISGRYRGESKGGLMLAATDASGQTWSAEWVATPLDGEGRAPLARVWARGRVRELEDRYLVGGDRAKLEQEIIQTSLRFGVLSRFTAFVAVDRSEAVNPGGDNKQVTQPIESPSGWGRADGLAAQQMLAFDALAMPRAVGYSDVCDFTATKSAPAPACAVPTPATPALTYQAGSPPPQARARKKTLAPPGVAPAAARSAPGVLGRLFSAVFGSGKSSEQTLATPSPDFRARVEVLFERLQRQAPDRTALQGLLQELRQLVKEMEQQDAQSAVEIACLRDITSSLEVGLAGRAVETCYQETMTKLAKWLNKDVPPRARGAFWK